MYTTVLTFATAPLVMLDEREVNYPVDFGEFVRMYTRPQDGQGKPIILSGGTCSLDNIDEANEADSAGGMNTFLTSIQPKYVMPPLWTKGVKPTAPGDPSKDSAWMRTGAVIVNEKGDGVLDAFYFYFFPWHVGPTVKGQVVGIHIGDWYIENPLTTRTNFQQANKSQATQHDPLQGRDSRGSLVQPRRQRHSIHLQRSDEGRRQGKHCISTHSFQLSILTSFQPMVFVANGSHALYPTAESSRKPTADNSRTPYRHPEPANGVWRGISWDPLANSWAYGILHTYGEHLSKASIPKFKFEPLKALQGEDNTRSPVAPTAWLNYTGHWGDPQPEKDDHEQIEIDDRAKWVAGPRGPIFEELDRASVCKGLVSACKVLTELPATKVEKRSMRWGVRKAANETGW